MLVLAQESKAERLISEIEADYIRGFYDWHQAKYLLEEFPWIEAADVLGPCPADELEAYGEKPENEEREP